MEHKIIAVVGCCGAGKSVATTEFVNAGFTRIYFGDVTFKEMQKRGLEINPENERKVREDLRKSGDLSIYAKLIEPDIKKALETNNVVLESLYAWSEYKYLKEIYKDKLQILAIVTNRENRIKRLCKREFRPLTKDEVITRDYAQIEKLEQGGPIAHADYYIVNNGGEKAFIKKVDKFIEKFLSE